MNQKIDPEEQKRQDEFVKETKKVVYPLYLLGAICFTAIWIGQQ